MIHTSCSTVFYPYAPQGIADIKLVVIQRDLERQGALRGRQGTWPWHICFDEIFMHDLSLPGSFRYSETRTPLEV
jgi:hypothetical protein